MKKYKIIILTIISITVLLVIMLAKFIIFKKTENSDFTLRNVVINVGVELSNDVKQYINEPIENNKKYVLDIKGVDTSKEGTYTYSVSLGNLKKNGTIEVVNDLYVEAKDVYLEVGETLNRGKLISYCSFDEFTISVLSEDLAFNEPGEYPISFLFIKDDYVREFNITAHVYDKDTLNNMKINDTDYSYNSYSHKLTIRESDYYVKFDKALKSIDLIDSSIFTEMYKKANTYDAKDFNFVYIYNKHDYIIGLATYIELQSDSIYEPKYMFLHREQN